MADPMNHPDMSDFHKINITANQTDPVAFDKSGLYDVPTEIILILSLFYGSISIIAVIGNTLVIWIVATTRQMQTVTNLFIANLALADVVIGMFAIPFQFQAALLQRWNLPDFFCPFLPFVQTVSLNVSVFTLTAIAVDRHRAIINPLRARPPKYISKIVIVVIWVLSSLFSLPFMIAFRVMNVVDLRYAADGTPYNSTRPFCDNVNLSPYELLQYRYYLTFVQYFIPFSIISFVYIQMAIRLWGSKTPGNAQDSRDVTLMRNKKRVIKMLIIVVVLFGVCWFPLQLYNVLHVTWEFIDEFRYINIVWFCCDWLAMSNSCYNPFIYGIYNEKFKREFRRRFPMFRRSFETTDMSEKNVSMCTRASSIRSTLTTTTTKAKYLIPQRIVGNSSGHNGTHYNALTKVDSSRNNNCSKGCKNGCRQMGTKSSWLFNKSPRANTLDWNAEKNNASFPKVYFNSDQGTTMQLQPMNARSSPNKSVNFQALNQAIPTESHDDISKSCCCQKYDNLLNANQNGNLNGARRLSNAELEQLKRSSSTTDGDDSDSDITKSIIKINNVFNNSCRDSVFGNCQSKAININDEKLLLVDSHGNSMKMRLNEDEVIL